MKRVSKNKENTANTCTFHALETHITVIAEEPQDTLEVVQVTAATGDDAPTSTATTAEEAQENIRAV